MRWLRWLECAWHLSFVIFAKGSASLPSGGAPRAALPGRLAVPPQRRCPSDRLGRLARRTLTSDLNRAARPPPSHQCTLAVHFQRRPRRLFSRKPRWRGWPFRGVCVGEASHPGPAAARPLRRVSGHPCPNTLLEKQRLHPSPPSLKSRAGPSMPLRPLIRQRSKCRCAWRLCRMRSPELCAAFLPGPSGLRVQHLREACVAGHVEVVMQQLTFGAWPCLCCSGSQPCWGWVGGSA